MKKGFLALERLVDEVERTVEVDVGAIAFGLNLLVVAEENGVGVAAIVFSRLGWLTQAAAKVDESLLETLVGWTHGVAVAQVPFAEDAGLVSSIAERFGYGYFFGFHHGSASPGIHKSSAVVETSCH